MTLRAFLWFCMVAALPGTAPANQPKGPDVVQQRPDGEPKAQPRQTQTKPPVCRRSCGGPSTNRTAPLTQ